MTSDSSAATATDSGGTSFSQRSSLPWAQVVRSGVTDLVTETEPQTAPTVTAPVESDLEGRENGNSENESGVKRSVWSKPSPANGAVDGSSSPVMGAAAWPALSELTRPSPKSLSFQVESSSKSASDGSNQNPNHSQAPVISQTPQKAVKPNPNHPTRQRSTKRGGSAGGSYNRPAPPPPPPMPPYPLFNPSYGFVPPVLDPPVRDQSPYNGNTYVPRPVAGVGSHSHPVHDHPFNRKRNNFGPRPRGDGGAFVNRDHHDREWFGPRSHGVIPHHAVPSPPPPPRYMQPAHLGPPFIAPQPIRPYGAPMVYEMPPPPPPFVYGPPIHPRASSSTNLPSLSDTILHQIEYYFSDDNLVKDHYLRSNMDEEGWVPLTLIAGFHRVKSLTSDLQMVLSSIKDSSIVEVQGETLRRRNDWRKWVKPSVNLPLGSTTDSSNLQTSLQKLSLDKTLDTELSVSTKPDNGDVTPGDESLNPNSSS